MDWTDEMTKARMATDGGGIVHPLTLQQDGIFDHSAATSDSAKVRDWEVSEPTLAQRLSRLEVTLDEVIATLRKLTHCDL